MVGTGLDITMATVRFNLNQRLIILTTLIIEVIHVLCKLFLSKSKILIENFNRRILLLLRQYLTKC